MRKTVGWLVSLVVCLGLAVPDLAAQGKGGTKGNKGGASDGGGTFSVCVTFRDDGADRIRSDGIRDYCDGSGRVLAIVGKKRGGFRLDTNKSRKAGAGRTVSFDFAHQCVQGADCFPPGFGDEEVDVRLGEEYDDETTEKREPTGQKLDIVEMDGGATAFGALVFNIPDAEKAKWCTRPVD